tara:strand:- start:4484 stop:5320 length:837 start_codon:yes stop_codon:yes gene_type:complete
MAKENKYLQIEFGTGNLFAYSKEEKEGYEQHESSKGNISYREYHKEGVYGIYRGTSIRETKFGKEVSVHMVDIEGGNVYISFPLFDQNKGIAVYAESLIALMPALEVNFVYRIFPYAVERKGTQYKNYGVSIKHADMKERTVREDYQLNRLTYTYTKDEVLTVGDIPAVKWTKHVDGSMKKDQTEKDTYLYKVLEDNATGSQKMSNKTSGGEPPKAFDGALGSDSSTKYKTADKLESNPEPIIAYEQDTPKPAPTPAPAPAPKAEAPKAEDKSVKLPF